MGQTHQHLSTDDGVARLVSAGAHLVLCRPDKRPLWRGWQKRRPSADVSVAHLDGAHGPIGVVPWSLHSTALDVDQGDPGELFDNYAPWADIKSRRGAHYYYDDDQPRGNAKWSRHGCSGDIRGARGFLVLHQDGPERLADALDRRTYGEHRLPRDLFELAGLEAVLGDPTPAPIAAESVTESAAPIQIDLERVIKGGRGVALFNQCRWWSYAQGKGDTLEAWTRRVVAYVTEQNGRFRAPITATRVQSTAWSIASWTFCGGGALDHGVMAQTRRGIASGKVRRSLTYDRDRVIVARLDAGNRQAEVARAFGVSQATVSRTRARLERRRRPPRELCTNLIVRRFPRLAVLCQFGKLYTHTGRASGPTAAEG